MVPKTSVRGPENTSDESGNTRILTAARAFSVAEEAAAQRTKAEVESASLAYYLYHDMWL